MSCYSYEPKGTALATLQRHLPTGLAWDAYRIVGKNLYRLWAAFASAYDDMSVALCAMINELNPYTTVQLIGEWERSCGLPDACLPIATTLEQRRALVLFRLSKRRWTTAAEWHELAALFGLTIDVTPGWYVQRPCLFGNDTSPFDEFRFPLRFDIFPKLGRFRVYVDITNVDYAGFDYGAPGVNASAQFPIPFGYNNALTSAFQCLIDRVRPANVIVIWNEFPNRVPYTTSLGKFGLDYYARFDDIRFVVTSTGVAMGTFNLAYIETITQPLASAALATSVRVAIIEAVHINATGTTS